MISSKALAENFNPQSRLKFNHGFTNQGCFRCDILKVLYGFEEKRDRKSIFNAPDEIFGILKMFKNNKKFTRAACWISSKISDWDKSTTLTIFLCSHYCCSLWWRLKVFHAVELHFLLKYNPLLIHGAHF